MLRFSLLIICSLFACGCAVLGGGNADPLPFSCEGADWYGLGMKHGFQGQKIEALETYQERCGGVGWLSEYLSGRNAGLVEFCSSPRGFELGRTGGAYTGVCPPHLEPEFLESVRRGRRIRELESENREIEQRLGDVSDQPGSLDRGQMELLERRAQIRQEINNLIQETY